MKLVVGMRRTMEMFTGEVITQELKTIEVDEDGGLIVSWEQVVS